MSNEPKLLNRELSVFDLEAPLFKLAGAAEVLEFVYTKQCPSGANSDAVDSALDTLLDRLRELEEAVFGVGFVADRQSMREERNIKQIAAAMRLRQ